MSTQRFDTAGPGPVGAARRGLAHGVRVAAWAVPVALLAVAVAGDGPVAVAAGLLAVVAALVAWWYRRFLADYAAALGVAAHGTVEVAPGHLVVDHPGVLSRPVRIPWAQVRGVFVDTGGSAPGRFVLPGEEPAPGPAGPEAVFAAGGSRRARRRPGVPLLASLPVVPDVLVLLDPPAELAWRYPFIAGPFNPPGGDPWSARPWTGPAPTAAFLLALADPDAFAAAAATSGKLRALDRGDVEFLRAEGLLP